MHYNLGVLCGLSHGCGARNTTFHATKLRYFCFALARLNRYLWRIFAKSIQAHKPLATSTQAASSCSIATTAYLPCSEPDLP